MDSMPLTFSKIQKKSARQQPQPSKNFTSSDQQISLPIIILPTIDKWLKKTTKKDIFIQKLSYRSLESPVGRKPINSSKKKAISSQKMPLSMEMPACQTSF